MPTQRIGGLIMLAFSIAYAVLISDIPVLVHQAGDFNARSLPVALATAAIVLSFGMILCGGGELQWPAMRWRLGAAFLLLMSVYGLALRPLGFIPSTVAFLGIGLWLMGERRVMVIIAVSGGLGLGIWLLLTQLMGVWLAPLPQFPGVIDA